MDRILLLETCYDGGDFPGYFEQTRSWYNPATRQTEEDFSDRTSSCSAYAHPQQSLIDSYAFGSTFRRVYHNGAGGLRYEDMVVTPTVVHATCFGSPTGSINLAVAGGVPGYAFQWADGPSLQDRFLLVAGTYTVTVSGSGGGSVTFGIVVSQNPQIQVQATVSGGSITLKVTGGIPGYTYLWEDGLTTKDRTGLEAGVYWVTITDSIGCSTTISVTIATLGFHFSKNPVALRLQAVDLEEKPNLSFICEVWVEREYLSENFERVGVPLEQPADKDGSTVFNVQEVLDAYLKPHFPAFGQNYVSRADGAFLRFFLQHTERFGEIPENGPFTQIDQNYVLLGGLSDEEYQADNFPSFLDSQKPFFTWDPAQKTVFPDQPEYLFFLPLSDGAFQVRARVTFTDGTLITVPVATEEGAKRHELWCLPAGYAQLGLATVDPQKKVRSWRVSVVDANGDPASENRTYTLETDFYQHRRYFLYLNSIGGVNTLACTGAARKNLETEAQQIDKPLGLNYDPELGDVQVSKKYGKPVLSVNSGYKTRPYMEALQDFEISPMVRLVGKDRYVPGAVATRRASVLDEMKTLNSLSFDFVLPKMYRYTPAL